MKYAFKKVRRIIINDLATKKHRVTLNDLKNFKISGSQDTIYAEGQEGAKLAALDVNKVSSIFYICISLLIYYFIFIFYKTRTSICN